MRTQTTIRLALLCVGAVVSATITIYYGMLFADIAAIYVGYDVAGIGVPGIFGLIIGASIAAIVSRLQSEKFVRLWYFPVICSAAGVTPILLVIVAMNLGPT